MVLAARLADLAAGTRCRSCGAPGQMLCALCACNEAPPTEDRAIPGVDRVIARWGYAGVPRSLILDLKLRAVRSAAVPLAAGMIDAAHRHGLLGSVITWVPGRRRDIRVRGYDHAAEIAREAAARLGLPVRELLIRRADPPDQTRLTAVERLHNLQGAFEASPCTDGIVLVDDLVTTGATAGVCARALRAAGAPTIEVLVPCRV